MAAVAFLWHMHQPYYEIFSSLGNTSSRGEAPRPQGLLREWWRFSRSSPRIRATFNLVPSLLVQLEAFAADQAATIRYLELG